MKYAFARKFDLVTRRGVGADDEESTRDMKSILRGVFITTAGLAGSFALGAWAASETNLMVGSHMDSRALQFGLGAAGMFIGLAGYAHTTKSCNYSSSEA
jgi:hypothetical protein